MLPHLARVGEVYKIVDDYWESNSYRTMLVKGDTVLCIRPGGGGLNAEFLTRRGIVQLYYLTVLGEL